MYVVEYWCESRGVWIDVFKSSCLGQCRGVLYCRSREHFAKWRIMRVTPGRVEQVA